MNNILILGVSQCAVDQLQNYLDLSPKLKGCSRSALIREAGNRPMVTLEELHMR